MLVLTALVYPAVLALLCAGAGLLVDRASGRLLAGPLILPVGAAALIAVSQLTTYIVFLAPATPVVLVLFAAGGFALAWWQAVRQGSRAGAILRSALRAPLGWPGGVSVLVYLIALAPVLAAGRPTFSSFMALSDSAVHLIGADYLIHHGQSYAHLDLRNSYGQFINDYYNTSYPSGADTLFGGSALALGLPLIWAFQPFVAFMLASAAGPAWLLVRRVGLGGAWAALATLSMTLPALVYAYELLGSVKEIAVLGAILALGVLAVDSGRWLRGPSTAGIPFALLAAAGVSALGVGFGVWVLAAAVVVLGVLAVQARELAGPRHAARRSRMARGLLWLLGIGAVVGLVSAWPTWSDVSGSVQVTQTISATSNPGNLQAPLRAVQALGVWLHGSYKLAPGGGAHTLTYVLIALTLAACVLGVVRLIATGQWALIAWLALVLVAWLAVSASSTTWVSAKTLMLTSPVAVLLAWAGVAALRESPLALLAPLVAFALVGGVLASDALQYHSSNLAPTARYDELASLNARFAGRGPTLFTDFDEYSMYELRDLDVGGPDFVYPPGALASIAGGYGRPVDLQRAAPGALAAYPLIVTRRDPLAARPPAAYSLAWQGTYYQVWARRPGAPAALAHVALGGAPAQQCARLAQLSRLPVARGSRLVAASAPEVVSVAAARAAHPRHWGRERQGVVLGRSGALSASFTLPRDGEWSLWLQGQLMPSVRVTVDGRAVAKIGGQLAGNSLVPDTTPPATLTLSAGAHRVSVQRADVTLAPGDGGSAVLDTIVLSPAGSVSTLHAVPAGGWRALCGRRYSWAEIVPVS